MDQQPRKKGWGRRGLHFLLALIGLFCCYRLMVDSAKSGISRLFTTVAIVQSGVGPADNAIKLAPGDPEAHYTRALALVNLNRLTEAVAEFQQATQLRPNHYYQWLDLGVTLDRLDDQGGAQAALRESIRLAPSFAQPRWQLGNLLYRQERFPEAFVELREGVKSNPSLVEGLLQLAWAAGNNDVATMVQFIQPRDRRSHLELASFLAKQGRGSDAARQVREAGVAVVEKERALLHQTISALLAARKFSDAYDAWAATHSGAVANGASAAGQFLNGNFVEPIPQNDPGFGWQLSVGQNVFAFIDPSGPINGARSVRMEFGGESSSSNQLIYQLVLVQPGNRYTLRFMARAENLITGGPPIVRAVDAGSDPIKTLGQSEPLSTGTRDWTNYQLEFLANEDTSAVIIGLQRLTCKEGTCPVFGKLWLGNFTLSKT